MKETSGIEVYSWFDQVPPELKTRNQLKELGLRPTGQIKAKVVWKRRGGTGVAYLYDSSEVAPKKDATEAQLTALEKARLARSTCPYCGTVKNFILPKRWSSLDCESCYDKRYMADRKRAIETAKEALNDPLGCILDTETTDLNGYVLQIGVVDMAGKVLLDSLVNPLAEISPEAQRVHGISAEMLRGAPSFAELLPQLQTVLAGRKIWVYNLDFDEQIVRNERRRIDPENKRKPFSWLGVAENHCAMLLYSSFVGEPYEEDGQFISYRYQALPYGDHSAVKDCLGTLQVLHDMATATL
jgi:DNA polymerase-3 subunit epsilon